jgi:hypothetical protein
MEGDLMKKIAKILFWIFLIGFLFFIVFIILVNGGFGDRAQFYCIKAMYHVINPEGKPTAEIVIDLKKDHKFIMNSSKPSGCVYLFDWRPGSNREPRLGVTSEILDNPFEYYRVKIILDDTTFTIPNARRVFVYFKDYADPKYRIKNPIPHGIDSVQILALEGQPVLENKRMLCRRTDHDFAFDQHQKFVSMFDNLGFSRDPRADEVQKGILQEKVEKFNNMKYLEYKTWTKENFEFTLILDRSGEHYINGIYINPKNNL